MYMQTTLARLEGYAAEDHRVVTKDGYILTIHRILPRSCKYSPCWNHRVVFLQHGLMGSSDNWVTNLPSHSLAYQLANSDMDVWMGNFRGNIYSRGHVSLTHQNPEFWKFSFDEMATYDFPAMIYYVLERTGAKQIDYIGHSMGSTVFFAATSTQPQLQAFFSSMVALAPVTAITGSSVTSPLKFLAPVASELQSLLRFFGSDEDLLTNRLLISLWDPYRVCKRNFLCRNIQFFITGFDTNRGFEEMLPLIISHNPAGASTQTLFHFGQLINSGVFQMFDHGFKNNLLLYGYEDPPEYDVARIAVPVHIIWAPNDWLVGEEDVRKLEYNLPNLQSSTRVNNPVFSHLDFLWARDANELVYQQIFRILDWQTYNYDYTDRNDRYVRTPAYRRLVPVAKKPKSSNPIASFFDDIYNIWNNYLNFFRK